MSDSNEKTHRIKEIDIVKALAIVLVVAGHSSAPFTHFIYLFHVAVFFIASGMFFKNSSSDSVINVIHYIYKKVKQLWLPYFFWNCIFTVLNNYFIKLKIYASGLEDNYKGSGIYSIHSYMSIKDMLKNIIYGAFFKGGTQIGGALWFLAVLFILAVLYCWFDFLAKIIWRTHHLKIQFCLAILLLIIGYILGLNNRDFFGLGKVFSVYYLYYFGVVFRRYINRFLKLRNLYHILLGTLGFSVLLYLNMFGTISIVNNSYMNPIFFIIASISGWTLLLSISHFLSFISIKKVFESIGKRTLSILALHFLAFKVVALIIIICYDLPLSSIAAFPNLFGDDGFWWLLYTIAGVSIPLGMNYIFYFFFRKICNEIKKNRI